MTATTSWQQHLLLLIWFSIQYGPLCVFPWNEFMRMGKTIRERNLSWTYNENNGAHCVVEVEIGLIHIWNSNDRNGRKSNGTSHKRKVELVNGQLTNGTNNSNTIAKGIESILMTHCLFALLSICSATKYCSAAEKPFISAAAGYSIQIPLVHINDNMSKQTHPSVFSSHKCWISPKERERQEPLNHHTWWAQAMYGTLNLSWEYPIWFHAIQCGSVMRDGWR